MKVLLGYLEVLEVVNDGVTPLGEEAINVSFQNDLSPSKRNVKISRNIAMMTKRCPFPSLTSKDKASYQLMVR